MPYTRQLVCHQEAIHEGLAMSDSGVTDQVSATLEALAGAMADVGYPDDDIFDMRLAVTEAVANAVRHGNQGDPTKPVQISFQTSPERVLVVVEDQGSGFDPRQVPDPHTAEGLAQDSGRGLYLMRALTSWLRFNSRGNCVTLCKRRSED
jgi:serine/threonine-protein kinase RsbW